MTKTTTQLVKDFCKIKKRITRGKIYRTREEAKIEILTLLECFAIRSKETGFFMEWLHDVRYTH